MQQAVAIFTHALRQVFGNLAASLQLSALPYAAQVIATILLAASVPPGQNAADITGVSNALFGKWLLTLAILVVTSLIIAVNWHRFILRNEPPRLLPRLHGGAMGGYLVRLALIGLIALALAVPVLMVVGTLFGGSPLLPPVLIALSVVASAVVFRLSVGLPAIALDDDLPIGEGWARMGGLWPTLLSLALITASAQFGLNLVTTVAAPSTTLRMMVEAVTNWLTLMVGLSLLTTLYGHYIEGRPLR